MKKLLVILVFGLFWCNVGLTSEKNYIDLRFCEAKDSKKTRVFPSLNNCSDLNNTNFFVGYGGFEGRDFIYIETTYKKFLSQTPKKVICINTKTKNVLLKIRCYSESNYYEVKNDKAGFYYTASEKNSDIAEKPETSPDENKIVPAGSGSGFFVSKDGHAITNYHVIEDCDINKLSFKGSQTDVKVLAVDKVNDIAILKSNIKPDVIFSVSNEDVSLLEDVIVAGFPLGKEISSAIKTHKGVVTALAGAGDNYSFFQTDATINQGNSGGPIINQKGNVVGIAVATWVEEGVQGVHFGIKSSTLKTFASANGLTFASPNHKDLSNKNLGKLITKGTVYIECHMSVAKIKKMIAQAENRKAFFKEHK